MKDNQSIASSEATTLVNDDPQVPEERTTLTGKPISYEHDNFTNMMLGDGGAGLGVGGVGANFLPPGYTDKSRVRIPIKMSDVEGDNKAHGAGEEISAVKSGGLLGKSSKKKSDKQNNGDEITMLMMSRGDYLKYWAKDDNGAFLPNVVEPPEGRTEWFRKQVLLNEEMYKDNPTLGKEGPKKKMSNFAKDYFKVW